MARLTILPDPIRGWVPWSPFGLSLTNYARVGTVALNIIRLQRHRRGPIPICARDTHEHTDISNIVVWVVCYQHQARETN